MRQLTPLQAGLFVFILVFGVTMITAGQVAETLGRLACEWGWAP